MSDFLQRLVVRHYSIVPRVLPNANTYFSAGAELAASEPAPEVGTGVSAAPNGVDVTTSGVLDKPVQPPMNRQPTVHAETVHQTERVMPGIESPDSNAGFHQKAAHLSNTNFTPEVVPISGQDHNHSPPYTSSPTRQPDAPPVSLGDRAELPKNAAINRISPEAVQSPVLPSASADTNVTVPLSEAEQADSAAVTLQRPSRSRRALPPHVSAQAPIKPADSASHLTPGRDMASQSESLRLDSSFPDSKGDRAEQHKNAIVNRLSLETGQHPVLPSGSADTNVEIPFSETGQAESAAVALQGPSRSRRVLPPHVSAQAPIKPADSASHLTPGRDMASQSESLHLDSTYSGSPSHLGSKPSAVEMTKVTGGIEPVAANTKDSEPGPSIRHRIASIPDSLQHNSTYPADMLAAQPITPTYVAAMPIAPPPSTTPSITISIGTIEVRAAPPPQPPVRQPPPAVSSPRLSLDEYLRRRNGGGV